MVSRVVLENYLSDFLQVSKFTDYAPNGLQVSGREEISKICTAVSASLETIVEASDLGADALLVHHGFFWRGESSTLTGVKFNRISALIKNQLSLFAYHLPLDCHLQLGNNAEIAKILSLQKVSAHAANGIDDLLWQGKLGAPYSVAEFSGLLANAFSREPTAIAGGQHHISHIAWCSGAAQDLIEQADSLGVDAFISGEVSERTYYQAREMGLHYFACGHHATERFGIKALGEHLALQYNINHCFIDSHNPL